MAKQEATTVKQGILSPKGASTRERVLAYSREVFIDQGYDALVLRRIAEILEMKLSNVQYYFKTKDELVTAIIDSEERQDIQIVSAALDKYEDPEEALSKMIGPLLNHWRGRSGAIFVAREFFARNNTAIRLTKNENDGVFFQEIERLVRRLKPGLTDAELKRRRRLVVALLDGGAISADPGPINKFVKSLCDAIITLARGE